MTKQERLATLCAMLGNSIFGLSFMFSRVALGIASPAVMLMVRFGLAALTLCAVAALAARQGDRRDAQGNVHSMRFNLAGRPLRPLLALGLVQPVLYFLCESHGIRLTNATCSGVIIALEPIAALIAGALMLREIPRRAQVFWSLTSIAGVVVMTMQQSAQGDIHPLGVLALIGAVAAGAVFLVLSRRISKTYSALERTTVMMLVAFAVFASMAAYECRGDLSQLLAPLKSPAFMGSMLYLSLVSSVAAFLMLNYAGNTLPVAKTTAFCNLTTVISVFAGAVFLGEPFGLVSLLASAVIILGVWKVQKG